MAGAGYKLFNTGDVLLASEVNTYLQQQVTMVFADAAARTTALSAVLAEGMMSYLQDTNSVEVYNGTSWVNVGNAGDITEVQAGTGISVASGTGPIPVVTNSMATEITAKGDLIVGTGSGTFDNLAVGTNGYTLVADSAETTGLKWAAPSSGLTLISRQTFSTVADTGTTFDGVFSSTYKTYQIVIENFFGSTNTSDMYLQLRYAGPTTQTSTYNWNDAIILSNGTTTTAWQNPSNYWQLSRNTEASSFPLSAKYTIFKVGNASERPQLFGTSSGSNSEEATNFTGQQTTARTYTGLIFSASTGTISGTIAIYGMAV